MADTKSNEWKRHMVRRAAPALVAVSLAGCAGTHVGDTWQCGIAQGAVCTSVADADPAVPRTEPKERLALHEPLHEVRGTPANVPSAVPEDRPGAAREARPCDTECGPFTWLARLFAADEPDGLARPAAASEAALPLSAHDGPVSADAAPADTPPTRAQAAPAADDLRVPETLGRIWIGPFVDAGGLYREAGWVRLVIAPARWRQP